MFSGNLYLHNVTREDEGTYLCKADNGLNTLMLNGLKARQLGISGTSFGAISLYRGSHVTRDHCQSDMMEMSLLVDFDWQTRSKCYIDIKLQINADIWKTFEMALLVQDVSICMFCIPKSEN